MEKESKDYQAAVMWGLNEAIEFFPVRLALPLCSRTDGAYLARVAHFGSTVYRLPRRGRDVRIPRQLTFDCASGYALSLLRQGHSCQTTLERRDGQEARRT